MKRFLALLIAMLLICSFCGCGSKPDSKGENNDTTEETTDIKENEDYFTWIDDDISGLTELGKKQTKLAIPKRCTSIIDGALNENPKLEVVEFRNDDTVITSYLFSDCTALKKVVLPANITVMEDGMFSKCEALEKIVLSDKIEEIGDYVFYKCKSLKEISLSNSLTAIGNNVFSYCEALEKIEFPDTLKSIDRQAFNNSGLKEVKFNDGLETIGEEAFFTCNSLEKVELPASLKTAEDGIFLYCENLAEIYLPEGVTEISSTAFSQYHSTKLYVKQGSFADTDFDNYNDGSLEKVYY